MPGMVLAAMAGAVAWSVAALWLRLGSSARAAASRTGFGCLVVAGTGASGLAGDTVAHYWRAQTAIPFLVFFLGVLLAAIVAQWAARPGRPAAARPPEPGTQPSTTARPPMAHPRFAPPPFAQSPTAEFPAVQYPTAQFPALPPYAAQAASAGPAAPEGPSGPTGSGGSGGSAGRNPHPMDIGVRETYSIGGGPGALAALSAFAVLSLIGAIVSLHTHTQSSGAAALFIALPLLVLIAGAMNLLLRRRLPRRLVLRGQVVRLWTVVPDAARGNGARVNTARGAPAANLEHYYCVLHCPLEDGRAPEGVRLKLNRTVYHRLYEGELIEVLVDPRRRRIKDLRTVGGAG